METFKFWKNDTEEQTNRVLDNFHNHFSKELETSNMTIEVKRTRKDTSDAARGFIWGCIVPRALQGFRDLGNDIPNNKNGLEQVYRMLKAYGGFFEIKKVKLTTGEIKKVPEYESFSKKGDRKRQSDFIEFCFRWCPENLGITIQDPEDWKRERGYKNEN